MPISIRPGGPKSKGLVFSGIFAFLATIAIFPKNAFAYIDPNTGGYVFQVLFPVISAAIAACVFFRDKTKKIIGSVVSRISNLFE